MNCNLRSDKDPQRFSSPLSFTSAKAVVVDRDLIQNLYTCKKVVHEEVAWEVDRDADYEHYLFHREVIAVEDAHLLDWYAWFSTNSGEPRWGFKLEFQKKYEVRSWDMAERHYSSLQDRYISGVGQHKHYYHNESLPRAVYGIPKDEISVVDPNQAVWDFCDECNIRLRAGYQSRIFPL